MLSDSLLSGKGDVVLPARGLESNTRPNSRLVRPFFHLQETMETDQVRELAALWLVLFNGLP